MFIAPNNHNRAAWASNALEVFINEVFFGNADGEDRADAIGDLMCNLMHLARFEGFDAEALHTRALQHFEEERGVED